MKKSVQIQRNGASMLRRCTCASAFQDSLYGPQMRVMNPLRKKSLNDEQQYRCTVCGREGR